jgi:hypothetical protein
MPENTITDVAYDFIERMEKKRRLLKVIITGCFIIAPLGLGINAFLFTALQHQKGGLSDIQVILIAAISIVSMFVLIFAINRYSVLKKWEKDLGQLELLEETIYREVLKSKTN